MINTIFNDEHYKPGDWWNAKGERYLKILQWGRKYPTRFVEEILEIQLTDQHDGLLYQETIQYNPLNCWDIMIFYKLQRRLKNQA